MNIPSHQPAPHEGSEPTAAVVSAAAPKRDVAALAKAALVDAWSTLRIVLAEPVGGVQRAWDGLPEPRRMPVTAVFSLGLVLAFVVGVGGLIESIMGAIASALGIFGAAMGSTRLGAAERFGLGMVAVLILGGILATSFGLRRTARVSGSYQADLFVAAAATVPLTLFLLPVGLLGISSPMLLVPLATFTVCYSGMLLFGGLRGIAGLPEVRAALGVPLAYIVADVLLYFAATLAG